MRRTRLTGIGVTLSVLLALSLGSTTGAAVANPSGRTTGGVAVADEDPGQWQVVRRADLTYEVSWTSPRRLPVTDARPEIVRDGTPLGLATVARNRRTVSVVVTARQRPDVDDLDVVLSGRPLDEPASPDTSGAEPRYAAVPPGGRLLDVDPGVPGDLEITSSDYRLPGFRAARMPRLVEMVGHVVRPADGQLSTAAPLVLFLHGRHDFCYDPDDSGVFAFRWPCRDGMLPVPSHLGYDYVQRLLASQGYATVSVAANGINAQDDRVMDGGAAARGRLVRLHLRQWATWAADGTYPVDMQRVVLVGHSRGGEGVNRASLEAPLRAPYRIAGQVLLAPTDFARQTAAYVPTVTVLPYCDGDVADLQGQAYTDLARDLTPDDTALRSSVLVLGANHNFFNTEWTPGISAAPSFDDFGGQGDRTCGKRSPGRLSAAEQRKVGRAYIAGAVQLFAGRDEAVLPLFDGSRVRVASTGDADVRTQALGGGRVLRRPGIGTTPAPAVGAQTRLCSGQAETSRPRACGRGFSQARTPHWVPGSPPGIPTASALEMRWGGSGGRGGLLFDDPLDVSTASSLDLRTVVDPTVGAVRVAVRLVDADGAAATVTPVAGGSLRALPRGRVFFLGKLLAQTLRVPLDEVSGVDLRRITEVDLVGVSSTGHVWLLDIAAVQPGPLPVVPDRRLPLLNLGHVRQVEGNRTGRVEVEVPFTLSAPSAVPARFVVTAQRRYDGRPQAAHRVVVEPGQTSGTLRYTYRADRTDDLRVRGYLLTAYPVRNLMTRHHTGRVTILDDDPRPALSIRRTPARQVEGKALAWTVTLSEPVGYDVFVDAQAVAGDAATAPRLSVGDLASRFRVRQGLGRADPRTPLHRSGMVLFTQLSAGRTSAVLRVPVRRDAIPEAAESLSLRIQVYPFFRRRVLTSHVDDPR